MRNAGDDNKLKRRNLNKVNETGFLINVWAARYCNRRQRKQNDYSVRDYGRCNGKLHLSYWKEESRNFVIEVSKNSREDTYKYDRSITGVCARRWRKGRNIPTEGQSVVAEYI
jgi:hypothetical protein